MEGIVKWFNTRKGYGFIKGDDGNEYFVHYSALDKGKFIRENDKVSFEGIDGERGKQAQKVVLLQKGSESAGSSESPQTESESPQTEDTEESQEEA